VVEDSATGVTVHTDPAAAFPVYAARFKGHWAWCTSARMLAGLVGAAIDSKRLACAVALPSVPTLAGSRTFFEGVTQLPPGSRIELPIDGRELRRTQLWRPDPLPDEPAEARLRCALSRSVCLRTTLDPMLACDMSGGLDSTSIALLAADSLPAERRLDVITVHPEGNVAGADLRYARLTAAAYPHRLNHHVMPLGTAELPYSDILAVPAGDEPAPSTLTQARLTVQLRWMRDHLGTRTHLTGDGGDSVFFQPPVHLADLIRNGRWRRAASEAFGWARLRHAPALPLVREAFRTAASSRGRALTALTREVGDLVRNDQGRVRWFPLLPYPVWAEPLAGRLLASAACEAAAAPDPLPGVDASVRVLVDEIREVARSAAADALLAAECGIDLHSPFLDPLVVDAVLRTPLDRRAPLHTYKPQLKLAMAHLLPPDVAARTTKGDFDADHHAGMRANLRDLMDLADGRLAGLGLVDPVRLRRALRSAAAGIPAPLASLEQALAAEAWLEAHDRESLPQWIVSAGPVGDE
jgi:asparagine synthase (glutamine-hydrolysing)